MRGSRDRHGIGARMLSYEKPLIWFEIVKAREKKWMMWKWGKNSWLLAVAIELLGYLASAAALAGDEKSFELALGETKALGVDLFIKVRWAQFARHSRIYKGQQLRLAENYGWDQKTGKRRLGEFAKKRQGAWGSANALRQLRSVELIPQVVFGMNC